eukprot:TRINITY_DN30112_c0_g1_i1.p1 TRINITY_DN30112_c0_g1~~TRINITY_DN30112_c0_g1_i1.p1  ORF type:complete len:559 (+),score=96.66 TRINITY_DN30112_c0_g1_i1:152-1828(+)
MGQQQNKAACSQRYSARSYADLQSLALDRGLALTRRQCMLQLDRSTFIDLLHAYDAGVASVCEKNGLEPEPERVTRTFSRQFSCGSQKDSNPMSDDVVVSDILDAPGVKGVDIGGSLIKIVLALPKQSEEDHFYPESFGTTGRSRPDLEFDFPFAGCDYALRFLSGATAQIEYAISAIEHRQRRRCLRRQATRGLRRRVNSRIIDEATLTNDSEDDVESDPGHRTSSPLLSRDDRTPTQGSRSSLQSRSRVPLQTTLFTTGGGAHKFANLFRKLLQVELMPVKEMAAVVNGLLFMSKYGPKESIFMVQEDGTSTSLPWPDPLFPFLIVNMGTGVSILKVNSEKEGDFVRIGGTACGGGTFLGLARALTSARTFEEALHLAEAGDAGRCDLLVQDIYGEKGSAHLGLPGSLTASNFGRLSEATGHDRNDHDPSVAPSEHDLVLSLLQMVTQQSVLLSSAHAKQAGCVDRVFFVGGFVDQDNYLARTTIAKNFRSIGGCAYFLKHSDYLGALGSLKACLTSGASCTKVPPEEEVPTAEAPSAAFSPERGGGYAAQRLASF